MIKLLLGGSPCTKWSIAQTKDRETQPNSGIGWELFLNYEIALEKYKPDYFLYENNKSASLPIKEEIARHLHVTEPDLFTPDNGVRMTHINSALVSAQNRERFYVTNFGEIYLPEDRGILLKDVLDGVTDRDKARMVLSSVGRTTTREYFQKNQNTMTFEPIILQYPRGKNVGGAKYGKAPTLTTASWEQNNKVVEPLNPLSSGKSRCVTAGYANKGANHILESNYSDNPHKQTWDSVLESVPCYATPCEWDDHCTPIKAISGADGKVYPVYKVVDGKITIKDKQYPIELPDGYYIVRKLTVAECMRLQTIPDWYKFPVSDTQAYKLIGNGWTIEVIKYLLSYIPNILNEEVEVLSMYDGMSCGQIALRELGCHVTGYFATEIDKYAIKTTQHNFPKTIQLGDAFQVRERGWCI